MTEPSRAELKYFVQRQREEIKALNEAGKLLGSTTDPQEIIGLTASYLHRAFPIALCGIFFLPERALHLMPFAEIPQLEMANIVRQVREAASALLNRNIAEEESVCKMEQPQGWMQPTTVLRSHLFSPITDKGRPVGLLSLFSGKTEAFTKEDQETVGIIAEQLGAALRNAFLVDELKKADELKNQMLSIVSHELSTPLTAIKEGINLILDGALGETTTDQRDFLGTVSENADRLERIVQKIKTSTELMTGQMKFVLESYDLRTLIGKTVQSYEPLAKSRGVILKLLDFPKPLFWPIDVSHLAMAVNQILENAIQATPKDGFVSVKLSGTGSEAEIQVTDTGFGISKEALPKLFDRFKSLGDINNRKMGGLGLGLFIAKALIGGHGGTLHVESTPGQGTQMTIHLPKQTVTGEVTT